jgi:DNA polymerase elongation subunit (family B)
MISYKWKGQKKVHRLEWSANQCDKDLLKKFSKVLTEADLVIGHNGDRFDLKWVNTRLLYHGLPPIGKIISEDTLKIAKRHFNLQSNKLDYIAKLLGLGSKLPTGGYKLWIDIVMHKCPKAMKKMGRYCDMDVKLLEQVHDKLAVFQEPTINLSGNDLLGCLRCENKRMTTNGVYELQSGAVKQRLRCLKCGSGRTIPYSKYEKEMQR